MAPVKTKDQLLAKFAPYLVRRCREWTSEKQANITVDFDEIFDSFAAKDQSKLHWSIYSLESFLHAFLPSDLRYIVTETSSVLHRMIRGLGSYPYQMHSSDRLTLSVFRSAAIHITLPYDFGLKYFNGPSKDSGYSKKLVSKNVDLYARKLLSKRQRVLFQSMALGDHFRTVKRDVKQDEDIIETLSMLSIDSIRFMDWCGKVGDGRPSLPSALVYPSSCSTDTTGVIPKKEFRSWLRLLLLFQRSYEELRKNFEGERDELEYVTDCMLNSYFGQDLKESKCEEVTWEIFRDTCATHMPNLLDGLNNLFEAFLQHENLPSPEVTLTEHLISQYLTKTAYHARAYAYSNSTNSDTPASSIASSSTPPILSYPLLSQLCTFIPPYLHPRLLTSTQLDPSITEPAEENLTGLLLITGSVFTATDSKVTYGVLFHDYEEQTIVFQLEPRQRVYVSKVKEMEGLRLEGEEGINVNFIAEGEVEVSLDLDVEGGLGKFSARREEGSEEGEKVVFDIGECRLLSL